MTDFASVHPRDLLAKAPDLEVKELEWTSFAGTQQSDEAATTSLLSSIEILLIAVRAGSIRRYLDIIEISY